NGLSVPVRLPAPLHLPGNRGIYAYILECVMTIASSRIFRSGNSEAVRLPKDVAFGEEVEVTIVRSGDVLTIYPKRTSLQDMVAPLRRLPGAGEVQGRDEDVVPDRPSI